MTDEGVNPEAALRRNHGLGYPGEIVADDLGAPALLPALDELVARAQELSRTMVASKAGASVGDFLADRAHEAAWQ